MIQKSFFDLLLGKKLILPDVTSLRGVVQTCVPEYHDGLDRARDALTRYFQDYSQWLERPDDSKARPLNCLLLGAPGSGKSFVAEELAKSVQIDNLGECKIETHNIASCTRATDVVDVFNDVGRSRSSLVKYRPLVVLIDEFDVRVGGASAIQNMISPMYDGKDAEEKPLHGVAFVFTGSYLRDQSILDRVRATPARLDLVRLCLDLYTHCRENRDEVHQTREMLEFAIKFETMRGNTRAGDNLQYLRRLEKIEDFLSRISGFTLELPSINDPLGCTVDPLVWRTNASDPNPKGFRPTRSTADRLERFARAQDLLEASPLFRSPHAPAIMFKDVLLRERLLRAMNLIHRVDPSKEKFQLKRHDLAFLCAAPLLYGMRSLEALIYPNRDRLTRNEPLDFRESRTHIGETLSDRARPRALWAQLLRRHDAAVPTEDEIEVVIGGPKGK